MPTKPTKKKEPTLTITFNWSGELPRRVSSKTKQLWAELSKPRTIKIKLPR